MKEILDPTRPMAIFDIDGVLAKPYVIEHFAKYLSSLENPAFKLSSIHQMNQVKKDYASGNLNYGEFAINWVNLYAEGIAGNNVEYVSELSRKFWDENQQHLFEHSKELIQSLKKTHTIIGISGSTLDGLKPLFEDLDFDLYFASEINFDESGVYQASVRINRAVDFGKQATIERLRKEVTNDQIWQQSFGFGDNPKHDFPILAHVGSSYLFFESTMTKKDQAKITSELLSSIPQIQFFQKPTHLPFVVQTIKYRLEALFGIPS